MISRDELKYKNIDHLFKTNITILIDQVNVYIKSFEQYNSTTSDSYVDGLIKFYTNVRHELNRLSHITIT